MEYDKGKTAARITQLHRELEEKEGHAISGVQLSKMIEEKTGIHIGSNTLLKYEKADIIQTIRLDCLIPLSQFYDVSYDYILGFSDQKREKTANVQKEYGLSDKALSVLGYLNAQKKTEDTDLPSDLEIINELFENTEFPDFIDSIRKAIMQKNNAIGSNYFEDEADQRQLLDTFTPDQLAAAKANKLVLLKPEHAYDFFEYELQKTTLRMVNEVADSLR